jgi:hypothetical protein
MDVQILRQVVRQFGLLDLYVCYLKMHFGMMTRNGVDKRVEK